MDKRVNETTIEQRLRNLLRDVGSKESQEALAREVQRALALPACRSLLAKVHENDRDDVRNSFLSRMLQYSSGFARAVGNDSNPIAYVVACLRNSIRDFHMRQRRNRHCSLEDADPQVTQEPVHEADTRIDQMLRALERLREPYQTVIRMHYLESRSYPEIAQQLSRPETSVRVQVSRGLLLLRCSVV